MSWIVQNLLSNRVSIKVNADINNDYYNDLLLIENAITHLKEKGLLNKDDLSLIDYFSYGNDLKTIKNLLKKDRRTISKRYKNICNRIAFYLGGYFTDDGYISYIQDKYKLTYEQVEKIRLFINGNSNTRIIRSPNGYRNEN